MSAQNSPRRVLITGGAQRLGAVLCRSFATQGWQVLCHYSQSAEAARALQAELRAQGAHIDLVQADLSSAEQRSQMMAHILQTVGPLQALVNNASLFEPDNALDFAHSAARQQLEVNLVAPLDLARHLALQPSTDVAAVVHILDQKVYNLNPDYFSYTISKLALERAVALQAQALAPRVRVCGVAPGLMLVSGPQSTDNFAAARHANLLRQPLDPKHVAQACVFLASNPAITGTTLCVDNGQHLVPLPRDIMFVVDDLLKQHLPPSSAS